MRCELPILLRCCFCFPLRYGLLAWTYTKQITNVIWLVFLIGRLCDRNSSFTVWGYVTTSFIIISIVLDVAFNVFFLISAHTKDYMKMRIFYRYSIIAQLCLNVLLPFLLLAWWIYIVTMAPIILIFLLSALVPSLVTSVLLIIIQGYLVILVKSELVKLKNNAQFEFVNHAAMEKSADSDIEKQNFAST